jgi:high-affinity nickel permease
MLAVAHHLTMASATKGFGAAILSALQRRLKAMSKRFNKVGMFFSFGHRQPDGRHTS